MQASTPGGSSPSLLRYRVAVASRALAAIGGGYLLSAACAATGARAMVWLGVERADAALGSTLLAFIIYAVAARSEEHTSELQSQSNLVCRLLLEKKKTQTTMNRRTTHTNQTGYMT